MRSLTILQCCLCGEASFVVTGIPLGYGKHLMEVLATDTPEMLSDLAFQGLIASTLAIEAVAFSKTSFALTLLRLSQETKMRWIIWFIIITVNIAMGMSTIITWVQCSPVSKGWHKMDPGYCWPSTVLEYYGISASAYSGAMDFVLAFLPWNLIWSLKMSTREKIGITAAMSMGIL
jgi:hypothetical protein